MQNVEGMLPYRKIRCSKIISETMFAWAKIEELRARMVYPLYIAPHVKRKKIGNEKPQKCMYMSIFFPILTEV